MKPIGLFCHWHTGSTILTKILAAAGMQVGNNSTGFIDRKAGQEHPVISTACNTAYLHSIGRLEEFDGELAKGRMTEALTSYVKQAEKNNWKFFGIKSNFMLGSYCWDLFGSIFKTVWPKMQIIITLRHPIDICKTTNDDSWPDEQVVKSWMDTVEVTKGLVKDGAILIQFPFNKVQLKSMLQALGLKHSKSVVDTYNVKNIKNISTAAQIKAFEKKHPGVGKAFAELKKLTVG